MTMMATQEPTDPSVLLTLNATATAVNRLKSITDDVEEEENQSHQLPPPEQHPNNNQHDIVPTTWTPYNNHQTATTESESSSVPIRDSSTTFETSSNYNSTNSGGKSYDPSLVRTPTRSSLANDPNLTPIASIKRPRANLNRQNTNSANRSTPSTTTMAMMMSPSTASTLTSNVTHTPSSQRYNSSNAVDETPLSPMHKIKPVLYRETVKVNSTEPSSSNKDTIKDKVEELFSPVVQFLHEQHDSSDPHVTATKSTASEDPSVDLNDVVNAHHRHHYNTEDEAENEGFLPPPNDTATDDDDDDVSMSRPEQQDYSTEGEFNPWQFIAGLPPYDAVKCHRPPITLPPLIEEMNTSTNKPRKTLVLDLDETLVHCSVTEPTDHIVDFTFPVQFNGETYSVHVKCRPYLQEFLKEMCQHFEVIVFTASQKVYADALLNILDPDGRYIHHRLFRESCLAVDGNYLKDLNVLGRDLSRTVLVDNSPHAFGYQVSNGIPIESWFDCPQDRELLKLQRFLLSQILPADDVRVPVRNKFQSHVLIAAAPPFPH